MSSQSQSNIETIRGIYMAFSQGDVPAVLKSMDENVEWEPGYEHNSDIPWLKSDRGVNQVAGFFAALRVFEFKKFEVIEILGHGPWVVALTSVELVHGPTQCVLREACEPHVWKLGSDGKVVSMRHAADTRSHAHVAGLDR